MPPSCCALRVLSAQDAKPIRHKAGRRFGDPRIRQETAETSRIGANPHLAEWGQARHLYSTRQMEFSA
jgi:hypothetical protein